MKPVICLFLPIVLTACSVPATADSGSSGAVSDDADTQSSAQSNASETNLIGVWTDENAIIESCGLRSPVFISLELTGDEGALEGQFTLASRDFPFEGSAQAGTVTGLVSTLDGSSLSADLTLQNGRLRGSFSAADEVECRDGARSRTVYEVALGR